MKKDDIFIIDENGLLIINKDEVRATPEYKAILVRDKGSEGDHDGRKKAFAFKELLFVYMYSNPSSIYRDLPDTTKEIKCKAHALLPDKWKVDKVIRMACDRFVEDLNLTALFCSYLNASKGIYSLGKDLEFFNNKRDRIRVSIEKAYEQIEAGILEDEEIKKTTFINRKTTELMELGLKIVNIANSLPTAYDTLETLKKKVIKEQQDNHQLYGGGKLGNREA